MHWEQRFRSRAEQQEGLLAVHQLDEVDATTKHWHRAARNGRWELRSPRVLRLRGAPETEGSRVLAAVLDGGPTAALHGPSALAWLGMPGFTLRTIDVVRPRDVDGAPL